METVLLLLGSILIFFIGFVFGAHKESQAIEKEKKDKELEELRALNKKIDLDEYGLNIHAPKYKEGRSIIEALINKH